MVAASFFIFVLASAAAPEAIERCRAAHSGDSTAHIACLETALRNQQTAVAEEEIGLDQVKARERARSDEIELIHIEIVSIAYDSRGRGVFRTTSGQVWQETETIERRPRLSPAKTHIARIEHGKFGGYRMYVDGIRWMFKVERLE